MDVHNALLNRDLDEEIYMKSPRGFAPLQPNLVRKLRRSLHRLRQASQQWYLKLAQALQQYGFTQCPLDHSIFVFKRGIVFLVLLIYVDYLILIGDDSAHCKAFKIYLNQCFNLKDLVSLKCLFGIEVARGPKGSFCDNESIFWIYYQRQVF